jgi:hypothetical protein
MKIVWSALFAAAVGTNPVLPSAGDVQAAVQNHRLDTRSSAKDAREERLTALRRRAKERIDDERTVFSAAELVDIEARYASAFRPDLMDGLTSLRRPEGEQVLKELVRQYPRANRAGCALLLLAQHSTDGPREKYLRWAIDFEGDAWFESGVQVAALARAMLAVHQSNLVRPYRSVCRCGTPLFEDVEDPRLWWSKMAV